ncbi:MAG: lipopolysaccharide kinase InaA family protein [Gemmatimonadota bacterium]
MNSDATVPAKHARDASVPATYIRRRTPAFELVAHESIAPSIGALVEQHGTLYDWAAGLPQVRALRGRAPVYVGDLPGTDVRIAVRHVWHGGLLAPLTSDRFRAPTRAPLELANALRLHAAGIPTTDVLAYALYPAGPGLRRVDVATRFIPDAADLGMVLAGLAPGISTEGALPRVASLLEALAMHTVLHPDLNVKNILLVPDRERGHTAFVIDVDVVQFDAGRPTAEVMGLNVARLLRSMRKWRARFGAVIDDGTLADFEATCLASVRGSA